MDGSVLDSGRSKCGGFVHDMENKWLGGFSYKLTTIPPVVAEIVGFIHGTCVGLETFAFGRAPEKQQVNAGVNSGSTSGLNSRASKLSYRDKLLSPGCGGFLVQHSEEDDIVKGWKDYFHRMNEHAPQGVQGRTDEEEDQTSRREEGKPGKLEFTAEEYTTWCLPWMNSLIIKVLGAHFPTYIIRDRINRMWRPKDPLKLIPLRNGYYIVSFSNREDKEYSFQEGPWMIDDHYLIIQRWRPNFNPWKADLQCNIAAWIRLPDVPFEFYNIESLRRLGNMIGKMIKIDRSTSIYDKGGFARICVEIDLKKLLVPTYMVFGEERPIIYEGLHLVCFEYGKFGHKKEVCPSKQTQVPLPVNNPLTEDTSAGGEGDGNNAEMPTVTEAAPSISTGDGTNGVASGGVTKGSPFGKIWILRRDFRGISGTTDVRKGSNGALNQSVDQVHGDGRSETRQTGGKKDEKGVMVEVNGGSANNHGLKTEWVPVGSKRKSANKGKDVSMETRPIARELDGAAVGPLASSSKSPMLMPGQVHCIQNSTLKTLQDGLQSHEQGAQHQKSDELMTDQDKTQGEVATPQSTPTVSQ
ncbi:hypothetical protein K1719_036646 [Acacia pycnantha]|nr:hypothetical protein K1719_036646 [Acacia pycnantha]